MHISFGPIWRLKRGDSWKSYITSFWDTMCQIFAMLHKWEKAVLEIWFVWVLNDKSWLIKDNSQVSYTGAEGQCDAIQSRYVII